MKRLAISSIFFLSSVCPFGTAAQSAHALFPFGWKAYSRSLNDVSGVERNEASLGEIHDFTAAVIAERPFNMNATATYAFTAAFPLNDGAIALRGIGMGYKDFHQQQITLAYGRPLASWVNVGAQMDYFHTGIPHYGSARALTFGLASLLKFKKYWSLGLQTFNPLKITYNAFGFEALQSVYRLGIGYQPSSSFLLSVELMKTNSFPFEISTAFYYKMISFFAINGGVSTGPQKLFFGITLFLKSIDLTFVTMNHQRLGLSPGMSLIYKKASRRSSTE